MSIKYEEAIGLLLENVRAIGQNEVIALWDSCDRILAKDARAPFDQPPFARSPLDGYALRSQDIVNASKECPVKLKVIAEEMAGEHCQDMITAGTAMRIMTGAPIPQGADCVIGQEDTDYGEDIVEIYEYIQSGQNICPKGEDYRAGSLLLEKGDRINPASVGVLSSIGQEWIFVKRKPRVLLISTGDELLRPGQPLQAGKIYDSNLPLMQANLKKWGADILLATNTGDDPVITARLIRDYVDQVDLVVTTGGVSVGKKDIMHDVYQLMDIHRLFWKVAIKPGMPTLAGMIGNTPIISLSGNPFGVVVTAELFVKPVILLLSGDKDRDLVWLDGKMENSFSKTSAYRRFIRGRFVNGKVSVTDARSANGTISTVCHSNCLIDIPAGNGPLKIGDAVRVLMM